MQVRYRLIISKSRIRFIKIPGRVFAFLLSCRESIAKVLEPVLRQVRILVILVSWIF